MKFHKSHIFLRIIFISIACILFALVIGNFLKFSTSNTDENLFINPPSKYYITKNIVTYHENDEHDIKVDTIQIGSLLVKANNIAITDSNSLQTAFKSIAKSKYCSITVFDNLAKMNKEYKIKTSELNIDLVRFIPSSALIIQVLKGGASDKAGLKEGDYLIRINGKEFSDVFDADKIMRYSDISKSVVYTILRNNTELDLQMNLVKFGVPFVALLQFIVGLLFFGTALLFLLSKPKLKSAQILGFGLLSISYYLSITIFKSLSGTDFFSIINIIFYYFSGFLGIALLINSTIYFPIEIQISKKRKFAYSILLITALIFPTILLLNLFFLKQNLLAIILDNVLLAMYFYVIILRVINNRFYSKEYKKYNRAIGMAYLISFVVLIGVTILNLLKVKLDFNYGIFTILAIAMIPVAYLYVIYRYKLLDIDIRIKRNIQYLFISFVWKISALLFLIGILYTFTFIRITFPNLQFEGSTLEVLRTPLDREKQDILQNLFLIAISITFSVLCWKMKNKVQALLDKRYFRTSFDYRRAVTEFSEILAKNLSVKDLTKSVIIELSELAFLKKVGFIVFRNDKLISQEYYGIKSQELSELIASSERKLILSISEFKEEFRTEYLPEPQKSIIRKFGFNLIVPVYSKMKLLGAILLGEKKSEVSYKQSDFDFLNTISGQVAIALENVYLYEDLAQQERIKHELEIARNIQIASLPSKLPVINGLDVAGMSLPALEVGGDFYDYLEVDNNELSIIIGDVSGKGTSAALYMSKVQGIIRTLHEFRLSPRKLLVQTNQLIYKYLEKSYFISATASNFNTANNSVRFARAGHMPIYYYNSSKNTLERIVSKGMVLGLSKDNSFERNLDEIQLDYQQGDIFLFITDGITEARNSSRQEFSEDSLINIISKNHQLPAEEIKLMILREVDEFTLGVDQYDDMTIVVVKAI